VIQEFCKIDCILLEQSICVVWADVVERFQNQFWEQHLLPKKPRIIWNLGNILWYLFGVTQLGHFQCF
jgi:hypothetical protein